jgi:hypothetical protein
MHRSLATRLAVKLTRVEKMSTLFGYRAPLDADARNSAVAQPVNGPAVADR